MSQASYMSISTLERAQAALQAKAATIARYADNEEPSLSELLADPMIRSLMVSDGVAKDNLCAEIRAVQARLTRVHH